MVTVNPYAVSRMEPEFGEDDEYAEMQINAYAVPSPGAPYGLPGDPYADALAFEFDSTPDPHRVQREPITDARQDATKPKRWWRRRNLEQDERESVQTVEGMHVSQQDTSAPVVARPNALHSDTRWTASIAPTTYSFQRDMNGGTPKEFNGIHFSMADHKRYPNEIFGMEPPRRPRGTYRADVAGWSEGDYDRVEVDDTEYTYTVPTVPTSQRSFRLDD